MTIMSPSGSRYTIQRSSTATAKFRIFTVTQGGNLTVNRLVLANGDSGNANGGAISVTKGDLTVTNSIIRNSTAGTGTGINTAFKGGGIWVQDDRSSGDGSRVSISNSAIHSNTAYDQGGGIFMQGRVTFTMFGSAVYSNTTKKDGANGGGLSLLSWANTPATFTIVNSSIYGNAAPGRGGGINASLQLQVGITSVLTLRHVTITGNSSSLNDQHRGNGLYARNLKITIQNSIISGNFNSGGSGNQSNCIFELMPTSGGNSPTLAHNITGAGSTSSSPPHCNVNSDPSDPLLDGPDVHRQGNFFIPRVGSPALDTIPNAACRSASEGGDRDQRGRARPNPPGGACDKGAIEYYAPPPPPSEDSPPPPPGVTGSSATGSSKERAVSLPTAMPRASTCLTLEGVWTDGIAQSTECQRVSGVAIGNEQIAASAVDAVDVWGWAPPDMVVCFFASGGSFKFIDTSPIPRVVYDLPAYSQNGMTCATIDRPGILALLPGAAPPPLAASSAAAAQTQTQILGGCMVTTTAMLNFRDGPAGEKIGGIPYDVTLTALERTAGWFKVDYHGEQGWISADYVVPKGSCGG